MAPRTFSAAIGMTVMACLVVITSANIIFGGPRRVPTPPPPPPPPPAAGDLGSACRTPQDRPGLCDRLQQCDSLMEHLRKRNIPYLKKSVCGRAGSMTLLCCPDGVPTLPVPGPSSPDTCGLTQYEPPRLVGGEPVKAVGTFPWMVALSYNVGEQFQCGGAVIGRRWILTAAHCVNIKGGPVAARIGDLNLATIIDDDFNHPPQNIEIEQIIRHPQYARDFKGLVNDIALVKLKTDIEYSAIVRPICLPSKKQTEPLKGETIIAGWGLLLFDGPRSILMQYARINITNIATCRANYAAQRLRVDERQHVCASGNVTARGRTLLGCAPGDTSIGCQGGVDTCKGDSGGPLMAFERLDGVVKFHAVGIVSFARGCGSPLFPGIYTRVDAYLDWIEATIAENGGS